MRLHRVQLHNYRGVIESEVSFSQKGVTIVQGPNEVGKTAISEGLQLAIDFPDSSQHKRVKAVQPVGRDEGPEVELSLSSGKYELVYRKRWLKHRMTTLEVTAPKYESLTGKEAHDRLNEIFSETLDKDLWQALRMDQGSELKLPDFGPQSIRAALDRAAGGDYASDREETLWSRIAEEYEKYWTPTGQAKVWKNSSEGAVKEARVEVERLEKQLQDLESDAFQMTRLSDESTRLVKTMEECEKGEREIEQRWTEIDRQRSEIERLDAIHSASVAQRDSAAGKWQHRQSLIANLDLSTGELAALEAEVEAAAPSLETTIRRREEAAAARENAHTTARDAQERLTRAIADRDHLRQLIEVDQLKERHDRYLAAEHSLKQAEDYLETARVDDEAAKLIEEAYIEDVGARSAAASAAAFVEVMALRDITLEIRDEKVELTLNESNRTLVEEEVLLTIQNVAGIRVTAGPDSKGLADQRRETEEKYRRLCEEAGVADWDAARRSAQERQDAQRNKEEAVRAIERDLRDLTPDVLLGKVENLTERVVSYPKERPKDPQLPAGLDEAQQIEAELFQLVRKCDAERRTCEDAFRNVEKELDEAQTAAAGRTVRIEIARSRRGDAASQLALGREGETDEALVAAVVVAQEKEAMDRKSLDDAHAQLNDADPESVELLLENARQVTKRASDELQSNRDLLNELKGSLELRGEQGLQTAYDEACNILNHLERDHERQEARAEAARLLRETFGKHRHQAHQRYIGPLKERIDQFGRLVFGPTFEVEIDEGLRVVGRTLNGTTLNVDQLSTGAREQLGVITRLACATIVSPEDGGAPVMIDDALGWSDPQRLRSMGAAIAAAGRECQVVVLTCTPGRYSHVGTAKVVALDGRTAPSASPEA